MVDKHQPIQSFMFFMVSFTSVSHERLMEWYSQSPLAFLDEAQLAFNMQFHTTISVSSIWSIIHDSGLTRKTLERRAIEINNVTMFCRHYRSS